MGRGLWYELRFRYKKLEFIATGRIVGCNDSSKNGSAFLGVAVPSVPASNNGLVWFSPSVPAQKPFLRVHVAQL